MSHEVKISDSLIIRLIKNYSFFFFQFRSVVTGDVRKLLLTNLCLDNCFRDLRLISCWCPTFFSKRAHELINHLSHMRYYLSNLTTIFSCSFRVHHCEFLLANTFNSAGVYRNTKNDSQFDREEIIMKKTGCVVTQNEGDLTVFGSVEL